MGKLRLTITLTMICIATDATSDAADSSLRLAKIFGDGMVLQQGKPIQIWGWAAAGSQVSVTLTQDSKQGEAACVRFDTERGNRKPATDDGDYGVTIRYVERNPPRLQTQTVQARAGDDGRWMVTLKAAQASFQQTWIIVKNETDLAVARNVLIGEIWVCAGQSNMGWGNFNRKDREAASADFPALRYIAWHDSYYKPRTDVQPNIRWQECSPASAERFSAVPYLYGMFLHRYLKVPVGIINVARGGTLGQTWNMRAELDSIASPIMKTVLADYDAETAAWDDPQQRAQILDDWKAACEQARKDHQQKSEQAKAAGKPAPRLRMPKQPADPRRGWSPPAGLFNATIMPIRDLNIRGVLYYQGENNNFMRWTRYESTFPRIPVSFRKAFRDPELPFGCISQPGWGKFGIEPEVATVAEGYAIVRDIQHRALADDQHAGMIATYPTGNSYIHPAEKLPVAEYASLWALAKVYHKPVQHTGNTYRELKIRDGKLYLFFDIDPIVRERWKHVTKQAYWQVLPCPRQGDAEFQGFIIAGEDRRWYPAKGRHTKLDGQWCIELSSDLVDQPVAARYGWANWPTGNMVGRNRLPMPTFRTDDWPIVAGVSYSREAQADSKSAIDSLRKAAASQAWDRKLRQSQVDLPRWESQLFKGDVRGQVHSKLKRISAVLDELQRDKWLSSRIAREDEELAKQIQQLRQSLERVQSQADQIGVTPERD